MSIAQFINNNKSELNISSASNFFNNLNNNYVASNNDLVKRLLKRYKSFSQLVIITLR
jgi:hypothetical protein